MSCPPRVSALRTRVRTRVGCIRIRCQILNQVEKLGRLADEKSVRREGFGAPIAAPLVSVGRIIEQTGNFRLRNGHGSGMIRLVCNVLRHGGAGQGALRSGNTNPLVGSVSGVALPALSCQV